MDAHGHAIRTAVAEATKPPFFVKGTWSLPKETLTLFYKGANGSQIMSFPDPNQDEMERLSAACQPATFGLNKADVLDTSYRNAGKLDRSDFAINIRDGGARLERAAETLLDLPDTDKADVELYKLNVYGPGSFFKPHKDTPRGKTMFGSLVVVLPTHFEGGELVIRHAGKEHTYDATEDFKAFKTPDQDSGTGVVSWIAFYSDVEHEVLPVKSGYRVTLTYNLYRVSTKPVGYPARPEGTLRSAFHAALSDPGFLPSGGLLGFGLSHSYPVSSNDADNLDELPLKGADKALMNVIASVGLRGEIKAVYLPDDIRVDEEEDIYVMSSTLLLTDFNEQYEEDRMDLVRSGGGTLFRSFFWHPWSESNANYVNYDDRSRYDQDVNTTVNWIIPLSQTTQFETAYIAYGNDASIGYLYANVNIIVDVPSFEDRKEGENLDLQSRKRMRIE